MLLLLAAVCCAVMSAALIGMLRVPRPGETALRAGGAVVLALGVVVPLGQLTGLDTLDFFVASTFAVAPVSVLIGAAVTEALPGRRGWAWGWVAVWAAVVYPLSAVVPLMFFEACAAAECRVQDFGGGLALMVSAAASVLLLHTRSASIEGVRDGRQVWGALVVWASGAVWLVSLEGVVDAYMLRILLAAVAAPLAGALAWLVVDALHGCARHPLHSSVNGLLLGFVAIVPGAAGISFPWSALVGAGAATAGALVAGAPGVVKAGAATRGALVVLTAMAIGYGAPAIAADSAGFVFSGRITAVIPPSFAFLAVVGLGVLLTAPLVAWARLGKYRNAG